MGKPTAPYPPGLAATARQSVKLPPVACAPHSTMCPANDAADSMSYCTSDQPWPRARGATTRAESTTRPVTTMCAPASSAARIGPAPRYVQAVIQPRAAGIVLLASLSSSSLLSIPPSTPATRRPVSPNLATSASTAATARATCTPPAFVMNSGNSGVSDSSGFLPNDDTFLAARYSRYGVIACGTTSTHHPGDLGDESKPNVNSAR